MEQVADFVLNGLGQGGPFRSDGLLGNSTDTFFQVGIALGIIDLLIVTRVFAFGRHGCKLGLKLRRVGQNTAVGRDRLWSGVIVSPKYRRQLLYATLYLALAGNVRVVIG
jgi:hypothetical protein